VNPHRVDELFKRLAFPPAGPAWPDATDLIARGERRRRRRHRLQVAGACLAAAGLVVATIPVWAGTTAKPRSVQIISPPPPTRPDSGGGCSAQSPGCGSAQGTAARLATMTWSTAPSPPLTPRYGSTTVWTGTELLVWGGVDNQNGNTAFNDGAAYNPQARTWTPMPPSPLSPRLNAFAVWTGSQALFWGGNHSAPLIDGATYNPATRGWAMMPPSPLRADPQISDAVVWTGTEMVVVEGQQAAAYDPADRSWQQMPRLPTVEGWQPTGVSAAWTGTEVVVWVASYSQAGNTVTGHTAAYAARPASSAWTPLPESANRGWPGNNGAPIGGRLLFLGPGSRCEPGASCPPRNYFPGYWFDPDSGTWTALPATFSGGAGPAVWTGSAMVVFNTSAGASHPGTLAGAAPANDVAAFDPSTGQWTNLAHSPTSDLIYVTVAWTGQQLIMLSTGRYPTGPAQMWTLS
jgi:hypothetical protein